MRMRDILQESSGNKLVPIDGMTVVKYHGRMMVLVDFGGARIPFYLSTGQAGKEKVPAGKWYPFFGIGSDGWINKTSQVDIANYYYSPALKAVAQRLDAQIGDIRDDGRPKEITKPGIDLINGGLSPVAHGDTGAVRKLIPIIKKLVSKIGDSVQIIPTMSKINPSLAAYKAGKMSWDQFAAKVKEIQSKDPNIAGDIVNYVMFQTAPG